jgi:hypothetical protein
MVSLILSQQIAGAGEQRTRLQSQLARTGAELEEFEAQNQKATLEAELRELEATLEVRNFPSREEALDVGSALTAYAIEHGLLLETLSSAETSATRGEATHSALSLSLEIQGMMDDLLGLLSLAVDYPAVVVQSLKFIMIPEGQAQWRLNLALLVFYEQ